MASECPLVMEAAHSITRQHRCTMTIQTRQETLSKIVQTFTSTFANRTSTDPAYRPALLAQPIGHAQLNYVHGSSTNILGLDGEEEPLLREC
jgi:hypothetical protein